jgi:hypothetical protein
MTPKKMAEIRRRKARQAAEQFAAERELRAAENAPLAASQRVQEPAQRPAAPDPDVLARFLAERARRHAAEPAVETTKKSDHVLSKSLSSERTPFPLSTAAPPAPAGGPPSTPNGNDTEERRRLGGSAASSKFTDGNDDRTATAQGIQRHSRPWILTVPAQTLGPPNGPRGSPGGPPGAGGVHDDRRRPELVSTS